MRLRRWLLPILCAAPAFAQMVPKISVGLEQAKSPQEASIADRKSVV